MKAAEFGYIRAGSLAEAFALLAAHGAGAKLLAGGQSLMPALNLRLSAPEMLIDIGRLAELRGIGVAAGVLRIGALTRHEELLESAEVAAHAPLLARAVAQVAHPAIRSRGTIGGSLANADPAAELPACVLALDARLVVASARGERAVRASDFFIGLFETDLAADEVLVAVEIDVAREGERIGFQELARRSGDYAMAGLAAWGRVEGGALRALRLAYFGVGVVPTLAVAAAGVLVAGGSEAEAVARLADDLTPHEDLQASAEMRLSLAWVLLRRVVRELVAA